MNITLTPELEDMIESKVHRGEYSSPDEVVRAALEHMKEWETLQPYTIDELRAEIQKGVASVERGDAVRLDIDAVREEGMRRLQMRVD